MKRLITIILILILILILSCCAILFVKHRSEYYSSQLEELSQQIETQFEAGLSPDEDLVRQFSDLSRQWEEDMNIFDLFIKHELIDQIERNLLSAGEYYRIGEYNEAIPVIAQIQRDLYTLYQNELPLARNLF